MRALVLAAAVVCLASTPTALAGRDDQRPSLDAMLATYLNGDPAVVTRSVAASRDFQALGLGNPRALERWLGDWHRGKAVLLLELAAVSTSVAPQYTRPLLGAGRRYLASRPADPADAAMARLWHRVAVALLQRMGTPSTIIEDYLDGLGAHAGPPSPAGALDARLVLARAVANERRCQSIRPELDRTGAAVRDFARSSRSAVRVPNMPKAQALARDAAVWQACLAEAITRFEAAAGAAETRAEARVRGGWMLFQQDDPQRALEWLDAVDPGDDRDVAYWAALFRGRILDALGRHQAAVDAYTSALSICPDAQSAGIGLALALMRTARVDEAEAFARSLRARTAAVADPWWLYSQADRRFVDSWMAELRGAVQ